MSLKAMICDYSAGLLLWGPALGTIGLFLPDTAAGRGDWAPGAVHLPQSKDPGVNS